MTFRTASMCFAGLATLGIAKLAIPDHTVPPTVAVLRTTKATRAMPTARLARDKILRMTPNDWKEHFEKVPSAIPSQTRQAITQLSENLEQLRATGADPQGEDAQVIADSMNAVLYSNWDN